MATVTVRSEGTMSPPAKTPAIPVIIWELTWTTPSSMWMSRAFSMSPRSASWPNAMIRESAPSSSYSPVGWGNPWSSSSIFSIVSVPPSACLTVDSHRIMMPSSSASRTSESWAGMRSRVRR